MWRHRFVSVRCLTSVYVYRVWYNRMPYWDGIWHVLVNFPFFCYTLIQWVFADGRALQCAKPSVNTQIIFQYNSILVVPVHTSYCPCEFAVVCLDRSGIGPMLAASGRCRVGSGILRHIYRVVLISYVMWSCSDAMFLRLYSFTCFYCNRVQE